jgi:glycine cleavage system H protein
VAEYDLPDKYRYSKDDEWLRPGEGDSYIIGISDYAQQQLGDVVFVEMPDVGAILEAGQPFGVIESVKAVSDLISPISGEVVEINPALEDSPETINESCYGDGWIIAINPSAPEELDTMMDADAYRKFIDERSK